MDPFDGTQEEFDEDFGAAAPSEAELLELLAQARATGNVPLRRLVFCYRALRRVTADSITYLEERDGSQAVDAVAPLSLAKFYSRHDRA